MRWLCGENASAKVSSIERGPKPLFDKIVYSGESEERRKCVRGKGTRFIVISFKSTLRSPGNRIEHVKLLITCATIEFSFS